jgi:hypothetical protein
LQYFPLSGLLGDRLFAQFDVKGNGLIDLDEFITGLSLCSRSLNIFLEEYLSNFFLQRNIRSKNSIYLQLIRYLPYKYSFQRRSDNLSKSRYHLPTNLFEISFFVPILINWHLVPKHLIDAARSRTFSQAPEPTHEESDTASTTSHVSGGSDHSHLKEPSHQIGLLLLLFILSLLNLIFRPLSRSSLSPPSRSSLSPLSALGQCLHTPPLLNPFQILTNMKR